MVPFLPRISLNRRGCGRTFRHTGRETPRLPDSITPPSLSAVFGRPSLRIGPPRLEERSRFIR